MKHVVNLSGGIGSWAAGKRVAERYGTDNLVLLFADTLIEHEDTYRFLREGAENIGGKLEIIAEGRTPFEVYRDVRFLGNSRVDPCSRVLKREPLDAWISANCDPADTIRHFGIHWSESDRFDNIRRRLSDWQCSAPLCEPPFMPAAEMHVWAKREGIPEQFLYLLGMPHANCGGGCCKMGQAGWERAYRLNRPTFDLWEREEEKTRELLGDVSMMKDRTGGDTKPLTLRQFRKRIESKAQIDLLDWGGCGCFSGPSPEHDRSAA